MYEKYFGLRESPFRGSPDPRFMVPTAETQEAYASLLLGINQRRGFILLTGEVGTGKTTILNLFLEWLRRTEIPTSYVFNPRLDVKEFLDFVLGDFGIACDSGLKSQQLIHLNRWLTRRYEENKTAVLVVDEAQNLDPEVLEEIRLLTNLETARGKLLQIVLAGQPELERILSQPELRQLRQRITLMSKTHPLSRKQVERYINERLRIAGRTGGGLFSPDAIDYIHRCSRGVPRVINLVCDHALIMAFAESRRFVSARMVEALAREFELEAQANALVLTPPSGDATPQVAEKSLEEFA